MKVLLLSPEPETLREAIIVAGDECIEFNGEIADMPATPDWIVSYGYRRIIREPLLSQFHGRIINIHISLLPWNRGADPNFWSWCDMTPKGVTIHQIDAGIDTGDILVQREVRFAGPETLRTSYAKLKKLAEAVFAETWADIRSDLIAPQPQEGRGSLHRTRDKAKYWQYLQMGYDTPVSAVEALAEELQSASFWNKYDDEIAEIRRRQ